MNTPIQWNASGSRQVAVVRPKWQEVRQGLLLAVAGHAVLFMLGTPGLILLGPHGESVASGVDLGKEDTAVLGLMLAGSAVLFGYGLLLLGQWRCLVCAPPGGGVKEMLFACLLCSLLAPIFPVVAHYLGGPGNYPALLAGPPGLPQLKFLHGAGVLQLAGGLLALASVLLFSAFARAVEQFFGDARSARGVVYYFLFVLFLLGGTAGVFLHPRHQVPPGVWTGLGAGWLLCLLWHTALLFGAIRCIAQFLRQRRSKLMPVPPGAPVPAGQIALRAAAYLNRTP